ncbi:MAG: aminopeptidase P family protein [Bacteroidales bacterium]|nr:aminopeptidase P family protein [Bacteroidales bacterium]
MDSVFSRRIDSIRQMMLDEGWDIVILTGGDPHSSEYPADRWKQVPWASGFTGEAGDLVVTKDHAGLWTDSRYFIQATAQLEGSGVELHKTRIPGAVPIPEWIASLGLPSPTIAVDGLCYSVEALRTLQKAVPDARIETVPDILSPLWDGRPGIPSTPVITLGEDIVGESREKKIHRLRRWLALNQYDAIILSALDEIAWLLNVRGSDIEYNPFVISYLLVSLDEVKWFVLKEDEETPDEETQASFDELRSDGVEILGYDEAAFSLASLKQDGVDRICIDPSTLNTYLRESIDDGDLLPELMEAPSPIAGWKAVKNEVEIAGMREAHFADGLAMERFLYWLEQNAGDVSEWEAACELGRLRDEIPEYRGDSFETISAYGPGAALPHYITPRQDAPIIQRRGLYLVDSGGQYLFGTTDITRTVPLGPVTELESEDYTLVLKGHIDLAMAIFPRGTAGCQIDALAREPLWKTMRNYGHGTGHGVGFFLGVHEGPQDIRQNFNSQPLLPGMICSDEPGIYREGMHGVRHENLVLVREMGENEFGDWLGFETLTLCHFDTSCLDADLLTREELQWLNDYNERVFQTLSPSLPYDVASWLREKTRPIIL